MTAYLSSAMNVIDHIDVLPVTPPNIPYRSQNRGPRNIIIVFSIFLILQEAKSSYIEKFIMKILFNNKV